MASNYIPTDFLCLNFQFYEKYKAKMSGYELTVCHNFRFVQNDNIPDMVNSKCIKMLS